MGPEPGALTYIIHHSPWPADVNTPELSTECHIVYLLNTRSQQSLYDIHMIHHARTLSQFGITTSHMGVLDENLCENNSPFNAEFTHTTSRAQLSNIDRCIRIPFPDGQPMKSSVTYTWLVNAIDRQKKIH